MAWAWQTLDRFACCGAMILRLETSGRTSSEHDAKRCFPSKAGPNSLLGNGRRRTGSTGVLKKLYTKIRPLVSVYAWFLFAMPNSLAQKDDY
jgi:hypothetical protein